MTDEEKADLEAATAKALAGDRTDYNALMVRLGLRPFRAMPVNTSTVSTLSDQLVEALRPLDDLE